MIRKFEKDDINAIMKIWENENIRTHSFIAKEYWKNNYEYVKDILPNADISENIDKNTNEIEYTMTWKK